MSIIYKHYYMFLQQINWTDGEVLAAFATGAVSIILAISAFVTGRINQRRAAKFKNEFEKELIKVRRKVDEQKSENDARRVYEFEARKRLYHEYEPLLFQLMEAADNAVHRIQSLARTARNGNLGENGWLSDFAYYPKSTIYKLFVPLAIYQIMQRRLTLVDVSVDRSIGLHYKLSKQAYLSYTDDFEFARGNPKIIYDPNNPEWKELRKEILHRIGGRDCQWVCWIKQ